MAKAAPKKKAAAKAAGKAKVVAKPLTKSQVFANLATKAEVTKKQVIAIFDALEEEIATALDDKGPGIFVIPNLVKITKKIVPSRPAGEYMDNFTKTMKHREAKPASKDVKVRALKRLRGVVRGE